MLNLYAVAHSLFYSIDRLFHFDFDFEWKVHSGFSLESLALDLFHLVSKCVQHRDRNNKMQIENTVRRRSR